MNQNDFPLWEDKLGVFSGRLLTKNHDFRKPYAAISSSYL